MAKWVRGFASSDDQNIHYIAGYPQYEFTGATLAAARTAVATYAAANPTWLPRYIANLTDDNRYAIKLSVSGQNDVWETLTSGQPQGSRNGRVFYIADNDDDLIYRLSTPTPQTAWTNPAAIATSPRGVAIFGNYLILLDDSSDEVLLANLDSLASQNYDPPGSVAPYNSFSLHSRNTSPRAALLVGDHELQVLDNNGEVYRYNLRTKRYVQAYATSITGNGSLVRLSSSDVGVHQANSHTITRYRNGSEIGGGAVTIPSEITTPAAVTATPDVADRLFILDSSDWKIKSLDTSDYSYVASEDIDVPAAMRNPTGFAVAVKSYIQPAVAQWEEAVGSIIDDVVSDWAREGNTDEIPAAKIPAGSVGGLNEAQVKAEIKPFAQEDDTVHRVERSDLADNQQLPAPSAGKFVKWNSGATALENTDEPEGLTETEVKAEIKPFAQADDTIHRVERADLANNQQLPAPAADQYVKWNAGATALENTTPPPAGLSQAQVDARVQAGVSDWAEQGNTDQIPANKLNNAPSGSGGLTQAQVDARVAAGVLDWAETGNTDPIPAAKLTNAPGGLTEDQVDARIYALDSPIDIIATKNFVVGTTTDGEGLGIDNLALAFDAGGTTVTIGETIRLTSGLRLSVDITPAETPRSKLNPYHIQIGTHRLAFADAEYSEGGGDSTSPDNYTWHRGDGFPAWINGNTITVSIYEPLGPENFVPEGTNADNDKVLKRTTDGPSWEDIGPGDLASGGSDGQVLTRTPTGQAWESVGAGGGGFQRKAVPAAQVDVAWTASGTAGAWSAWTTICQLTAVTASEAGPIALMAEMRGLVVETSTGGGDRFMTEFRLVRNRSAADTVLISQPVYGPRNLAAAGAVATEFANASQLVGDTVVSVANAQTGDVYRVEARTTNQVTEASATRTLRFATTNNFLAMVGMGSSISGQQGQSMSNALFGTPTSITASQAQSRLEATSTSGASTTATTTTLALPQAAVAGDRLVVKWQWHNRPGAALNSEFRIYVRDETNGQDLISIWPITESATTNGYLAWELPAGCASIQFKAVYDPEGSLTTTFSLDLSEIRMFTGGNSDTDDYLIGEANRRASVAAVQAAKREAVLRNDDIVATQLALDASLAAIFRYPHIVSLWRRNATTPTLPTPSGGDYSSAKTWTTLPTGWSSSPVVAGTASLWRWTALATWNGTSWVFGAGIVRSEDSFNRRYSTHSDGRGAHPTATTFDRYYQDANPVTGAWSGDWLPIYDEGEWTTLISSSVYVSSNGTHVTEHLPAAINLSELHQMAVEVRILEASGGAERWRGSAIVLPYFDTAANGDSSLAWRPGVSVAVDFYSNGTRNIWSADTRFPALNGATAKDRWGFFGQFRQSSTDPAGTASLFDAFWHIARGLYGTWSLRIK